MCETKHSNIVMEQGYQLYRVLNVQQKVNLDNQPAFFGIEKKLVIQRNIIKKVKAKFFLSKKWLIWKRFYNWPLCTVKCTFLIVYIVMVRVNQFVYVKDRNREDM